MNDVQMKTLGVLVKDGYVPIDRFCSEELAAVDDLVSLGYALVNPTEPVREAYATEAGRQALTIEKEMRRQRTEQKAEDSEKELHSIRRSWLQVLVQIFVPFVLGILTEYWAGVVDFFESLFR